MITRSQSLRRLHEIKTDQRMYLLPFHKNNGDHGELRRGMLPCGRGTTHLARIIVPQQVQQRPVGGRVQHGPVLRKHVDQEGFRGSALGQGAAAIAEHGVDKHAEP